MGKSLNIGIHTRLRGRFYPCVVDARTGYVKRRYPVVYNVICDAGLNRIATTTFEACMRYCTAGTGATTPATGDTILSAQVSGSAGHSGTYLQNTTGANGTTLSGDTFTHVRTYDFGSPSISTVYKEAGVTWDSTPYTSSFTPIFNHVLLNGATGIVVDSDEKLRLTYELDIIASPVTSTPQSALITIPGPFTIDGDWTLTYYNSQSYFPLAQIQSTGSADTPNNATALEPSLLQAGGSQYDQYFWVSDTDKSLPVTDPWDVAYSDSSHNFGKDVSGTSAAVSTVAAALGSYTNNTFTRTKTGTFNTGTTLTDIRAFGIGSEYGSVISQAYGEHCQAVAILDSVFTKSTSQRLVITFTYTWARA